MLSLRYYQRDAIDALYKYWEDGGGNGLIVLPTGAGKALVIAKLIEELLANYPGLRILNVTHSATLVGQNFAEFIGISPMAPAGIYSAGLGRRDAHAQVLFCGIQSVAKRAAALGAVDLVLVDEAHAISRNADTLYGQFFSSILERNPDSRVAGLTATDYRMDSGRLTEGDDRLFDDVVYEIGIGKLIEEGYLTRLSTKRTDAVIDLKGVGTRGGEYIPGQLSAAADRIIEPSCDETVAWFKEDGRKACMVFCVGQDNSEKVRDALRARGMTAESLTSRTTDPVRIITAWKAGKVQFLCSANMLTTGANYPFVDMIAVLFSTKSAGKYVQTLGRGTRNHPGKTDCLVLDYGGNRQRHGPIDRIEVKEPGKGDGEAPIKICPHDRPDRTGKMGCEEILHISVMVCTACGYQFDPPEKEDVNTVADDTPLLSTDIQWAAVRGRRFAHHPAKIAGNPPSVKVSYMVGFKTMNEWLCPQHLEHPAPKSRAFPKGNADRYWAQHGGAMPAPATVADWLARAGELAPTSFIQIDYSRNPRYPDIKGHKVGERSDAPVGNLAAAMGVQRAAPARPLRELLDDEIPF